MHAHVLVGRVDPFESRKGRLMAIGVCDAASLRGPKYSAQVMVEMHAEVDSGLRKTAGKM